MRAVEAGIGHGVNLLRDLVLELNGLWPLVNLRKNLFPPTKKVSGHHLSRKGKSVRSYADPRTPAQRIKDTGIMLEPQRHHLDEPDQRDPAATHPTGRRQDLLPITPRSMSISRAQ